MRAVQTFRENFEALEKQMSLLDYAVIIFVVGAAALAIAVIYNITATNLKERTREIATLMVLGYNKHETANMLIVENLVITGLGCVLGLPLGYGLLWWLVDNQVVQRLYIELFQLVRRPRLYRADICFLAYRDDAAQHEAEKDIYGRGAEKRRVTNDGQRLFVIPRQRRGISCRD